MASKIISFTLNGRSIEVLVQPLTTQGTVLREQLHLTAAKTGCRQGGCGSCTALLNGQPVLSCILPVDEVEGQQVITLEGITPADGLHQLQIALLPDSGAEEAVFDWAVKEGYKILSMVPKRLSLEELFIKLTREGKE